MTTYAIGDIHGCSMALDALLEALELGSGDRLVFLGDYVDRGPDSYAVVERVLDLERTGRAICLLGNHEEMALDAMTEAPGMADHLAFWLRVGGREALASYQAHTGAFAVAPHHLAFFAERCRPSFEDERFLYVHATAAPLLPLADQPDELLRWMRFGDPAPHVSGKTLVAGHTAQRNGVPLDLGHAVCVDTYCYGGGWLTALDTGGGRFVQANQEGEVRVLHRLPVPAGADDQWTASSGDVSMIPKRSS